MPVTAAPRRARESVSEVALEVQGDLPRISDLFGSIVQTQQPAAARRCGPASEAHERA
jgi:hypothetical protein